MGRVFVLAFAAALNPTLVAATTVMLLLENPKRLMLGYLLGAMMTSITLGIVIVFALEGSSTVSTTQHTLNPVVDIVLGAIALICALVVARGSLGRLRERRHRDRGPKEPPRWQKTLSKGSPRATFVVGAMLTLPGASYLAGLHRLDDLHRPTAETVLAVIAFNVIMLALLELPLLSFAVAPDWTPVAIERIKAWVSRKGRRIAVYGLGGVGTALVIKGVLGLI